MVKQINCTSGRTFQEFSLLTGLTKKDCKTTDVSLKTRLADNLQLKIPLISAAMTSVTGYKKVLALGKEGGIGIVPARLTINEQVEIVERVKSYKMGFVEHPVSIKDYSTIEEALDLIEKHGHSKIPVVDRNNYFLGLFDQQHYWETNMSPLKSVRDAMIPFRDKRIHTYNKKEISVDEAKNILKEQNAKYLVILDNESRLAKLAFQKDVEEIKVGVAITSYKGWQERVEATISAGADLILVDSSDGFSEFQGETIRNYKKMNLGVPIVGGNVITADGARYLIEAGADIIKIGMSSGSICSTQREKATGRAPMTALLDIDHFRNQYEHDNMKYIPLIIDGGVVTAADMIIALTTADAVMMGGYFNRFYEAAGEKLDKSGNPTRDENKIEYVVTYGEGSKRAQNLERYAHAHKKTFFEEGIEGKVPYAGRLKPTLKKDLLKIKAALSNAGCKNLDEFRENSVIELNSPYTSEIVSKPHDVQ